MCGQCGNECKIPLNARGYCGLKTNTDGKLVQLAGTSDSGLLDWYYDPLPTNCVGDWVCAGGTGAGYPKYSYSEDGPEYGYKNLAVFYKSCTFDCLFCQNWHYRVGPKELWPSVSAKELASKVDSHTSCICYFGGDPSSQIQHALSTSRLVLRAAKGRILRVCWETNGSTSRPLIKKMAKFSLESGGCIKFDLKAWNENLHFALTGTSNRLTLLNFEWLAGLSAKRRIPPFLIASTLIVPGYVEVEEVSDIARFISKLDSAIPYSLLAFSPEYIMDDMPLITRKQADKCLEAAKEYLENVRVGNIHLLV
jgi:pyruvate formate lyase activating enzyme